MARQEQPGGDGELRISQFLRPREATGRPLGERAFLECFGR